MNNKMLHRMKIAGEYQRKAIRALFPEEMCGHLDVIEKEMKMIIMDVTSELLKNCNNNDYCRDEQSCRDEQRHEQTSKAKKVDIV